MAKKKAMTEEELQNSVENGFKGKDFNGRAYRMVFDVLQKEPSYKLPSDFADKVMLRIDMASQRSSSQEMVWLYVGLIFFVIAGGVVIAMSNFKINFGVFKFISGYSGLLTFGGLFILGLQWIDRKFIHHSA